ncbi:hypothetical protein Adt_17124 [Abeliophyllum distichum]|uniref:Uncharacterized protein n=1 Tax=Abeliophyllum distichum TaxID=126358 RepID=A0ABD1TFX4_9LAMI
MCCKILIILGTRGKNVARGSVWMEDPLGIALQEEVELGLIEVSPNCFCCGCLDMENELIKSNGLVNSNDLLIMIGKRMFFTVNELKKIEEERVKNRGSSQARPPIDLNWCW